MSALVLPMAVLALWTIGVLTLIPLTRIRAARAGRVHVKDFRYVHSIIHLAYNNVLHRLYAFALGVAAIAGLWVTLLSIAIAG
jgi:hypothetical protein